MTNKMRKKEEAAKRSTETASNHVCVCIIFAWVCITRHGMQSTLKIHLYKNFVLLTVIRINFLFYFLLLLSSVHGCM